MTNPKTVTLKGLGVRKEGIASEAITPGHLIELGGANDLQKHSTAGGTVMPTFAVENDIVGDGIDVDYASGDQVLYSHFQRGEEVYALLADGESANKGDFLESNGDGTLRVAVTGSPATDAKQSIVAQAQEDLDLSASSNTEDGRIKVTIL